MARVHVRALWSGAKRPAKIPCFTCVSGGSWAALLTRRLWPLPMPDPGFSRAQQQYARMRAAAYAPVQQDAIALGRTPNSLRLADCTPRTLAVWRSTWSGPHPAGAGGWDWETLLRRAWRNPASFHLAIWSGKTLCGLAVGRVGPRNRDGRRNAILLDFIESVPDRQHPLRGAIAYLATSAVHAYGRILKAEAVRLMDPLPGAMRIYQDLGFDVVSSDGRVLYCERRIDP